MPPRSPGASAPPIPTFKLFGEDQPWSMPDMLHCESIAARSALHDWRITPHRHAGLFQVLHIRAGSAEVLVDDTVVTLQGAALVLVPQLCIHGFRFERATRGHVVTIAYPLLRQLGRHAGDALVALAGPRTIALAPDTQGAQNDYLAHALHMLETEYRGAAAYRGALVESLLEGVLILAARHCAHADAGAAPTRRRVERFPAFCTLVDAHFRAHAPVSFYAQRLGITAAHLNALCRQAAGRSALALIHERVLLEVKRNLVYTSMTVGQVSDAAGFSDPAYFTRFFTRATGMAPRAFRQAAAAPDA